MMGPRGGGFGGRSTFAVASALALALALSACASGPTGTLYDLAAATPPPAHAVRAQFRVGQATATADLDSDHILVRESQALATLADARWPEPLPALFRARLAQSFQNAGLARWIDGPAANANYEVDLDIRAFELDAQTKEIHVDIAAWIVSLGSGRIMADQIFTLRTPVASTDAANVAAAMDQAASTVMSEIVAFVAKKL
jgi:cholesterol transport system auxiliary component